MRILDGEQTLVRIFVGENDRWHHTPLHRALIERLRREGFAGVTIAATQGRLAVAARKP